MHALDPATGADLWAGPFVANDGPVKGYIWPRLSSSDLLLSTTNTVWSVADNGAAVGLNWSVSSIPGPSIPLTAINDSMVWVGGGDGSLYQIDFSSGSPVLSSVTLGDGAAAVGSPALDVFTDTAYVGTDAGQIYAVTLPLP